MTAAISIGRPLDNTELYILDHTGSRLPRSESQANCTLAERALRRATGIVRN